MVAERLWTRKGISKRFCLPNYWIRWRRKTHASIVSLYTFRHRIISINFDVQKFNWEFVSLVYQFQAIDGGQNWMFELSNWLMEPPLGSLQWSINGINEKSCFFSCLYVWISVMDICHGYSLMEKTTWTTTHRQLHKETQVKASCLIFLWKHYINLLFHRWILYKHCDLIDVLLHQLRSINLLPTLWILSTWTITRC